jgi:hypothetical protein
MNIDHEVARLQGLSIRELRARFAELFGEETPRTNNRVWLVKRIAWRLQARVEGDLSERARRRAAELANDADLRLSPPRPTIPAPRQYVPTGMANTAHAVSTLRPGTTLVRVYKGRTLHVIVLPLGFDFEGVVYPSLSAVAKAITGSHCSGRLFFRLTQKGAKQ